MWGTMWPTSMRRRSCGKTLQSNPSWKSALQACIRARMSLYCRLWRNILADKPRVTRFPVEFDVPASALDINDVQEGDAGMAPHVYPNENVLVAGSGMMAVDDNRVPEAFPAATKAAEEAGLASQHTETMAE